MNSLKFTLIVGLVAIAWASCAEGLNCNHEIIGGERQDGEEFTLDAYGPCVTFHCNNGAWGVKESRCRGDDGCYSPGEVFTKTSGGTAWTATTCTIDENGNIDYQMKN